MVPVLGRLPAFVTFVAARVACINLLIVSVHIGKKRGAAVLVLLLCVMTVCPLQAQKFGYIDSEYILRQLPAYNEAIQKIDSLAKTWEKEVKAEFKKIDALQAALKSEEVLLTEAMIADRQYKIDAKLKEAEAYREEIFGYEGLFFLKEKEWLEPLQEELYKTVEKVSEKHRLQLILDKAHPGILYIHPIHDYTEYVMEALGLSQKKDK